TGKSGRGRPRRGRQLVGASASWLVDPSASRPAIRPGSGSEPRVELPPCRRGLGRSGLAMNKGCYSALIPRALVRRVEEKGPDRSYDRVRRCSFRRPTLIFRRVLHVQDATQSDDPGQAEAGLEPNDEIGGGHLEVVADEL